ncbi:thioredoxin-disulfide reductase [Blastopirellula sp. JC732]|uniref:Thioredoxin-disulfide reductase n=1 Tax=Blastopirellula sediminis TaxID=2894196 RepID=A0A9X1MH45_9BACT|nr:thioredoxin-disulfide reductase [Blastopirellula sediminis]MCC9604354.1 thioredoxin-disulfide reductase [Blastopirellula sediminis]MCC9626874.1 thioredoxin-disulfide reductase [Blastopirellula sediminis]
MAEKVVIIGSGPAGWTAAIYAARAEIQPLVFEGAPLQEHFDVGRGPLGQLAMTTEVENFPGFPSGDLSAYLDNAIEPELRQYMAPHMKHGVSGPELMELMRQQAKNFGTRIIGDDIVEVDFDVRPFRLTTREGDTIEAHSVIVATGARANYLGLPSEAKFKNRGVSACAVCDGALPRFRGQPCIVVGGGDSAVEEADYMAKFASKVYLVHRRDELRASKIMAERAEKNPKIEIVWNSVVEEVLGDDENGVTGARLKNVVEDSSKVYDATGFFLGIGHTPNTDFLEGKLEMNDKNYLKWTVPFRTNTSVEGVFAAGDVADDNYRQAVTAAGSGCMAALDAERYLAAQGHH